MVLETGYLRTEFHVKSWFTCNHLFGKSARVSGDWQPISQLVSTCPGYSSASSSMDGVQFISRTFSNPHLSSIILFLSLQFLSQWSYLYNSSAKSPEASVFTCKLYLFPDVFSWFHVNDSRLQVLTDISLCWTSSKINRCCSKLLDSIAFAF